MQVLYRIALQSLNVQEMQTQSCRARLKYDIYVTLAAAVPGQGGAGYSSGNAGTGGTPPQ